MKNGIYNGRIINYRVILDPDYGKEVVLIYNIQMITGNCFLSTPISQLTQMFKILEIENIEQLKNAPCLVLVENNMAKTIGNFLFSSVENIYSDTNKIDSIDSQYWLNYDLYKKFKEDIKN